MKLIVVELVLGFGVPITWAVWELVSLRREQRRDAQRAAEPEGELAADRGREPAPQRSTVAVPSDG